MKVYKVYAEWDAEAEVWFVVKSNVPGLNAEAPTVDELRDELMELVPLLIKANTKKGIKECDIPIELLFQQHARLKLGTGG